MKVLLLILFLPAFCSAQPDLASLDSMIFGVRPIFIGNGYSNFDATYDPLPVVDSIDVLDEFGTYAYSLDIPNELESGYQLGWLKGYEGRGLTLTSYYDGSTLRNRIDTYNMCIEDEGVLKCDSFSVRNRVGGNEFSGSHLNVDGDVAYLFPYEFDIDHLGAQVVADSFYTVNLESRERRAYPLDGRFSVLDPVLGANGGVYSIFGAFIYKSVPSSFLPLDSVFIADDIRAYPSYSTSQNDAIRIAEHRDCIYVFDHIWRIPRSGPFIVEKSFIISKRDFDLDVIGYKEFFNNCVENSDSKDLRSRSYDYYDFSENGEVLVTNMVFDDNLLAVAILDSNLNIELETCFEIGVHFDIRDVAFLNSGNCLIWLTEYFPEENGDFYQANKLYRLERDSISGVYSFENENALVIYPNPSKDYLKFNTSQLEYLSSAGLEYSIVSLEGRLSLSGRLEIQQGKDAVLDVDTLTTGSYSIILLDNGKFIASSLFVKE